MMTSYLGFGIGLPSQTVFPSGPMGSQDHGQWPEFALEGIEDKTQYLQRNTAQQNAVTLLAEDDRRSALLTINAKPRLSEAAFDFSAVGKDKSPGLAGLDAQALKHGRRNYRIHCAGVNQELQPGPAPRPGRVGNARMDVRQTHETVPRVECRFCAVMSQAVRRDEGNDEF